MGKLNQYFPDTVTHPGVTLDEKLSEMRMSQKEFALRSGKPEKTISQVISGQSSITPDMAVVFEKVLGIPASFWMKRQQLFDEAIARQKAKENVASSIGWAKRFPYNEMAKKGWIEASREIEERTEKLLNFFGISSAQSWERLYMEQERMASYRISLKHTSEPEAISAWLRQGDLDAKKLPASPYIPKKFRSSLKNIRTLMVQQPDNFFIRLQDICLSTGVKLVYTPCLPHAPVNGCTRWLGDNPLIQLSGRHKRNDVFWFTFFHEAGHILMHGKKAVFMEMEATYEHDPEKELEADKFAIDNTLTEEEEQEIIESLPLTPKEIVVLSKKFNTHPAIIVGRLAHKGYLSNAAGYNYGFFRGIT
ncbi:MAG TPA: HigA family addiction module antitoxin [Syntrophorhabdus sp.]|jgi:addiction module HigA family antidote|nr:HigA family addiction module antitoxin [Syntrophorhabdus sp.]